MLTGAARVVADRLGAAVRAAGIADMRAPFGFVIRALAERDRTLTELAALLDVSKQAAIKVVDEMEARASSRREPDPADRRRKVLTLTEKGRAVRAAPRSPPAARWSASCAPRSATPRSRRCAAPCSPFSPATAPARTPPPAARARSGSGR